MADVQAPSFPTDHQKTAMKDLITSEPTIFDEQRKIFGTAPGMAIIEELQIMKDSIAAQDFKIAAQDSKIAAQKQRLDLLAPVQVQVRLIRKPILLNLACCPADPILRQARNGLAHGGQMISDLSTIDLEEDPAECAVLKSGFEKLYAVLLCLRNEFVKYKAVIDLMDIHANLLTLDVFSGKSQDMQTCASLLKEWSEWVSLGSVFDKYPFTANRTAATTYGRLMKLYGHVNPASCGSKLSSS